MSINRKMRIFTNLLLGVFLITGTAIAQNIDFTELIPGPGFLDARNGTIAKGDIDNDGDIDVFIAGKDGSLLRSTLYTNDGKGNFTIVPGTPFPGLEFGDSEFADIDNDGDLDLLLTGSNFQPQYFAKLYSNDGSGNFSLVSNTPFQGSQGDIAFEDVDNDNDLDLMMVGYDIQGNGFTKLYQNNGSGVYVELTSSTFEPAKDGSIAFLDYDNDNDPDVIVSGENNIGAVLTTLYSNNGSGVYSAVSNTPFPGVKMGDIGVADTDNDGDMDILLNGSQGGINWISDIYLNDGAGNFSLLTSTNLSPTSLGDAEFADFDSDGDMDILISGNGPGHFYAHIYENTGSNNFVYADTLNPMYLTSTAIADFDGDSDLDVIMLGIQNSSTPFKTRTFINNLTSVSILEAGFNPGINIYPNPSNDLINVDSNEGPLKGIAIYGMTGKLIFKTDLNSNHFRLSFDDYPSGTYFLRISDQNDKVTVSKFVMK